MRVLVLGGTSEASALCAAAAGRRDIAVTLSLAGRTKAPAASPVPLRIGGFGGVEGLARFLKAEAIDAVIDATHPFAAGISANAFAACAARNVPLLAFSRAPWARQAGDDWIEVDAIEAAVQAIGAAPRRVFLTQGRLHLAAFAQAPQHYYLVRAIERPAEIDGLRDHRLILSRGPFALADEIALLRDERIDILVTKNSGAAATHPKIEAARRLALRVIMLRRPPASGAATVYVLAEVLAWIDRMASHGASP